MPDPPKNGGELPPGVHSLGSLGQDLCRRILSRPQSSEPYASPQRVRQQSIVTEFLDTIGPRYRRVSFESFEVGRDQHTAARTKALRRSREIAEKASEDGINRHPENVLFIGPSGTGKDHLMMSMLKQVVENGTLVCWRNGQSLYSEFRDLIPSNKSEAACLAPLIRASLLAISDPAPPKGDVSSYGAQLLYQVIEERYRQERPTWMTINALDRKELDRVLGAPIVSRLCHNCELILCEWPDFRATGGKS